MDTTSKQLFDELHKLSKNIQNGLDEMLAFYNKLSRFEKRTLKLFIILTSDYIKYEEALKLLEKVEGYGFKETTYKTKGSNQKEDQFRA